MGALRGEGLDAGGEPELPGALAPSASRCEQDLGVPKAWATLSGEQAPAMARCALLLLSFGSK